MSWYKDKAKLFADGDKHLDKVLLDDAGCVASAKVAMTRARRYLRRSVFDDIAQIAPGDGAFAAYMVELLSRMYELSGEIARGESDRTGQLADMATELGLATRNGREATPDAVHIALGAVGTRRYGADCDAHDSPRLPALWREYKYWIGRYHEAALAEPKDLMRRCEIAEAELRREFQDQFQSQADEYTQYAMAFALCEYLIDRRRRALGPDCAMPYVTQSDLEEALGRIYQAALGIYSVSYIYGQECESPEDKPKEGDDPQKGVDDVLGAIRAACGGELPDGLEDVLQAAGKVCVIDLGSCKDGLTAVEIKDKLAALQRLLDKTFPLAVLLGSDD